MEKHACFQLLFVYKATNNSQIVLKKHIQFQAKKQKNGKKKEKKNS